MTASDERGCERVGMKVDHTWCVLFSLSHQKHPYTANIFKKLDGPCQMYKRLEDYTDEDVAKFPEIVKVPHL